MIFPYMIAYFPTLEHFCLNNSVKIADIFVLANNNENYLHPRMRPLILSIPPLGLAWLVRPYAEGALLCEGPLLTTACNRLSWFVYGVSRLLPFILARNILKNMSSLTEISSVKCFEGFQNVYSHESSTLGCTMRFGIYLPQDVTEKELPVIYYLSGLTCSESNFIEKSGVQKYASEKNIILVNPDTSPRGLNIPGDSDSWDFGVAASFYVDATEEPWKKNYKMFTYVTKELVKIINDNFPVIKGAQSIMGHSMGGHGALICALKNPGLYKCVSAFAPISNPSNCPWGIKAFKGYLGPQETGNWHLWDATELVKGYSGPLLEIFIDQGTADKFYKDKQLLPENFVEAVKEGGPTKVLLNKRDGYDHSYYYISTFIEEHIERHAKYL